MSDGVAGGKKRTFNRVYCFEKFDVMNNKKRSFDLI